MNKKYYKSLVASAILASFTQVAVADTIGPLAAVQDTWTDGSNAGTGNVKEPSNVLRIDTGKNRAFIEFTVSGIPDGHTVETAILTLTANAIKAGTYSIPNTIPDTFIAPIVGVSWDETTLTDLNDDALLAAVGPTIASATDIPVGTTVDFNITDGITGNGTYTFLINMVNADARAVKYDSSTPSVAENAPKLTITTIAPVSTDTSAPVFAETIDPIEINATGTTTDISGLINIMANDDTDGDIAATIVGSSNLTSGAHTVTLQATDAANNTANKNIAVNIKPLLELSSDQSVFVGESGDITVSLSGPAAAYPVTLDYSLAGDGVVDSTDTLRFDDATAQTINVTVPANATGGQTGVLTLSQAVNAQLPLINSSTITAVAGNAAPTITLSLEQNGTPVATITSENEEVIYYIDATAGVVTVTATIDDANAEDTHSISWQGTTEALTSQGTSFDFSPEQLSGHYDLAISVTEENTDELFNTALNTQIKVITTSLPELAADVDSDGDGESDIKEGYKDSDGDGILDYLDTNSDTTALPLAETDKPLMTETDLSLSLGLTSIQALGVDADSAVISQNDLESTSQLDNTTDTGYFVVDGASIINFTVSGMADGAAASVVYPLPDGVVLSDKTQYRKYTPAAGWTEFVSGEGNQIASADADELGNCPAVKSDSYIEGLHAGKNCIQLTIVDGGDYDADGVANGSIEDPGVLAESNVAPLWSTNAIALPDANINQHSSATVTADLSSYASDADGDTLTFTKNSGPAWLTIDGAGALSANLSGVDTGDYPTSVSVTDTKGQSAQTTVNLSVTLNKAPQLSIADLAPASQNVAYSASIASQVTDAEGDEYTINKISGPYWLEVSATGELSGTPLHANIGENVIGVELVDAKGAKTTTTFSINVAESEVRASKAGALSGALLAMLSLASLRKRKKKQ